MTRKNRTSQQNIQAISKFLINNTTTKVNSIDDKLAEPKPILKIKT